jgi:predicted esterase
MAVWAFHGAADDVVPILETARMIRALRNAGNEALFSIYPTAGHDSWTETYDNPELYNWMIQQQRKK